MIPSHSDSSLEEDRPDKIPVCAAEVAGGPGPDLHQSSYSSYLQDRDAKLSSLRDGGYPEYPDYGPTSGYSHSAMIASMSSHDPDSLKGGIKSAGSDPYDRYPMPPGMSGRR